MVIRLWWRDALHNLLWIAIVGLAPVIMSIAVLIARGELFARSGVLFDDAQFAIYATTLIGATFLNIANARGGKEGYFRWISYALLASVALTFFSSGFYVTTIVGGEATSVVWLRVGTLGIYMGAVVLAFISGIFSADVNATLPGQEFARSADDLAERFRRELGDEDDD